MKKKVVFILTKGCNLNCSYCYEKEYNGDIKFMNIQTFLSILWLFKEELLDIRLFGGEPLLNKQVIKYIIDNYENLNIDQISISTNGTMIDTELINFYNKYFGNIKLIISLDGDKNSHDYYRVDKLGNGTYEKILKNIHQINNKNHITINLCITPYFSNYLYEGVISLYKLGFKKIKFIIIYEYDWKNKDIENLISSLKKINKLRQLIDIDISFFRNIGLSSYNECENDMKSQYSFNYNGDLIPCPLYLSDFSSKENLIVGNIYNHDFNLYESFSKNINYFFENKNKFMNNNICEYYSTLEYKKNKLKINGLIYKIFLDV